MRYACGATAILVPRARDPFVTKRIAASGYEKYEPPLPRIAKHKDPGEEAEFKEAAHTTSAAQFNIL